MLKINVSGDLKNLERQLTRIEREQLPFATAKALTLTAQDVKQEEEREIRRVFDRPTPYTQNSLRLRPAKKNDLNAFVWLKDDTFKGTPATNYLAPHIYGGSRKQKRFERALSQAGLLPDGMYAVPGSAAKLDAYGNIDRGQLVQILSFIRAFGEQGYRANMSEKKRAGFVKRTGSAYFVGRPGGGRLPLGVWEVKHSGFGASIPRPVLIFVRAPKYKKTFKFFEVGQKVVTKRLPINFQKAMADALSTAR